VRYAAMTEALDRVFGRVMDALERTGRADDTLVVFTSDNGALGSVADTRPLRAAKGYLYEGGIRVPTMVRWPAVVSPGETPLPVISTDWFATILDAAGAPLPEDDPGDSTSVLPALRGEAMKRGALFFHYPNYAFHRGNRLGSAIRAGDLKLIERFDDGSLELYDLSVDLGETNNLAAERAEVAEALRDRLAAWREGVAAAMPTRVR
jgi:arylsulfatase A-like enzyme